MTGSSMLNIVQLNQYAVEQITWLRYRHQISLLKLGEFKRINSILFPLKSSENLWFSARLKLINTLEFA